MVRGKLAVALVAIALSVGSVLFLGTVFSPSPSEDVAPEPRPAPGTVATPTSESTGATEPIPSPPAGPGAFHGDVDREGGSIVMPITFPDGTRAEVVYPASLELGTEGVYPGAFLKGGPRGCHPEVRFSRSEIVGEWTHSGPPLAVFKGGQSGLVALWPGKRWLEPLDVMAFDFGDWVAALFCEVDPERDADALSMLARSLDARATGDGFLILSPRLPLRLVPSGFQVGPRITLENRATPLTLVELTHSGCSPSAVELDPGGTAQGCFDGGIGLYALGPRDFLGAVSEHLHIGHVKKPAG